MMLVRHGSTQHPVCCCSRKHPTQPATHTLDRLPTELRRRNFLSMSAGRACGSAPHAQKKKKKKRARNVCVFRLTLPVFARRRCWLGTTGSRILPSIRRRGRGEGGCQTLHVQTQQLPEHPAAFSPPPLPPSSHPPNCRNSCVRSHRGFPTPPTLLCDPSRKARLLPARRDKCGPLIASFQECFFLKKKKDQPMQKILLRKHVTT